MAGPEGDRSTVPYDRLLLTVGSVGKLLPVPGVAEHALGFRSIGDGLALHDHLVRQLEMAAAAGGLPGTCGAERDARCTFVVVGAGYTGTEVAAHGQLLTRRSPADTPGCVRSRSAGCSSIPRRACCPSLTGICRPPPPGC